MKFAAERAVALVNHAAAAMRIVKVPLWLVCIACMRDTTGREIERHLEPMRAEFRIAAFKVCLALGADGYHRTWSSSRARRLATILIFFAYLCQRSRFHGVVVWMVRGIPKGALAVAIRLRSTRHGREVVAEPACLNTVYGCIAELVDSGLLLSEQFAASKVPAWCCGQPKPDPRRPGEFMQWSFNYYFLTVCPFEDGLEGRIVPAPRDNPAPKLAVDLVAELEQRNAAAAEHWTRPAPRQDLTESKIAKHSKQWDTSTPVFYEGELELEGDKLTQVSDDLERTGMSYSQWVAAERRRSRAPPDGKAN